MPDKAYRPYLATGKTLKEMFEEPVKFSKEVRQKQSEFEKPYLEGDSYRRMNLEIPQPNWGPDIKRPDRTRPYLYQRLANVPNCCQPTLPALPDFPKISWSPQCQYCIIVCYEPTDCKEPIRCHAASFCTHDKSGKGVDTRWEVEALEGEVVDDAPGGWSFPSRDIYVKEDGTNQVIEICLVDGMGHRCCVTIEISCACNCEEAAPFVIDDTITPATIDPGGDITVAVIGGCPPYTWAPAGTGYSWASGTTDGESNTLTSAGGVCGVNYDPYSTITITDNCGNTATSAQYKTNIINTGGVWCICASATTGGAGVPCGPPDFSRTLGIYRHRGVCNKSIGQPALTGDCATRCGYGTDGHVMTAADECGGGTCALMKSRTIEVWACP